MPFKDELKEVYRQAIQPACRETDYQSLRVDEVPGIYNINKKIIQHIFHSEVIIADLTDWNPNVFYELGVAHSIDNKTIMIIREGQRIPFDVSTYTCIIYQQSDSGLQELKKRLAQLLKDAEEWRQGHDSTNPVQEHKPHDAFVLREKFERLEKQFQEKEMLIRKKETENRTLREQMKRFQAPKEKPKTAPASSLPSQPTPLEILTRSKPTAPAIQLRSQPLEKLPGDEVAMMLRRYDFYCGEYDWSKKWANPNGIGIRYDFQTENNGKTILDNFTGLMWQQGGSLKALDYEKARRYIRLLNKDQFAGYSDWRLPTLEEAMSLMEPEPKSGNLYIDPLFDKTQSGIWTGDLHSASLAWVVDFYYGYCGHYGVDANLCFVRAVRFGH